MPDSTTSKLYFTCQPLVALLKQQGQEGLLCGADLVWVEMGGGPSIASKVVTTFLGSLVVLSARIETLLYTTTAYLAFSSLLFS